MLKISIFLWLKIMIFIDFFSVALVVPILSSYFKDAGIDSKLYGWISSLYFLSQLVGGLLIGYLSDILSKKNILYLSFIGSGVSYLIVGCTSNIKLLFLSRIIVGLVKQSYTTSTLMIIDSTKDDLAKRSKELSQLSAISSISFLIGPSLGGLLYAKKPILPAICASMLFVINCLILCLFEPSTPSGISSSISSSITIVTSKKEDQQSYHIINQQQQQSHSNDNNNNINKEANIANSKKQPLDDKNKEQTETSIFEYRSFIHSKSFYDILFVSLLRLTISFFQSSLTSRNILHYYEDRFNIQTYQLGFLSSLSTGFSIFSETITLGPIMLLFNNNDFNAILASLFLLSIFYIGESYSTSFEMFIIIALFPGTILSTVLTSASRSLFTQQIPSIHLGKVYGIFNVASTCIGIIAPIYGSQLFSYFMNTDHNQPSATSISIQQLQQQQRQELVKESELDKMKIQYTRQITLKLKGMITSIHYGFLFLICFIYYIYNHHKHHNKHNRQDDNNNNDNHKRNDNTVRNDNRNNTLEYDITVISDVILNKDLTKPQQKIVQRRRKHTSTKK